MWHDILVYIVSLQARHQTNHPCCLTLSGKSSFLLALFFLLAFNLWITVCLFDLHAGMHFAQYFNVSSLKSIEVMAEWMSVGEMWKWAFSKTQSMGTKQCWEQWSDSMCIFVQGWSSTWTSERRHLVLATHVFYQIACDILQAAGTARAGAGRDRSCPGV